MNRLGDVPADVLFGLVALNNNLVAPAVIPAALRARALEPGRSLAELLVSQVPSRRCSATWSSRFPANTSSVGGGDVLKGLATLIANPSARERLDQLGDVGLPESLAHAFSLTTTLPREPDPRLDDPTQPLLPATKIVTNSWPRIAGYQIVDVLGSGGMGIVYKAHQAAAGPVRRSEDDSGRRRCTTAGSRSLRDRGKGGRGDRPQQHHQDL